MAFDVEDRSWWRKFIFDIDISYKNIFITTNQIFGLSVSSYRQKIDVIRVNTTNI